MSISIVRRLTAVVGVLALSLAASFVAVAPATAATLPGNINPDTPRTLTIHKIALDAANGQQAGTGQLSTVAGTRLPGAEFTVAQVTNVDLTTSAGWATAATLTPQSAAANATTPGATRTVTTGADGTATLTGLPIGLYLVTETKAPPGATNRVAPFLVTLPTPTGGTGNPVNQWIYDVNVYPKNPITTVNKNRVTPIVGSVEARNPDLIRWAITSPVPSLSAGDPLSVFTLIDSLPAGLDYVEATSTPAAPAGVPLSSVTVRTPTGVAQSFVLNTDYTLVYNPTTRNVTANFTTAGLARLRALPGSIVTLDVLTRATGLGVGGAGILTNVATSIVNEVTQTTNGTSSVGELTIRAIERNGDTNGVGGVTTGLVGAVYQVFLNEADALAGVNPITVGGVDRWTTGANGVVVIPFLTTGTYWVKEITPPAGFQLPSPSVGSTAVTAGDSVIPPGSPKNYIEFDRNQIPAFALPLTGGDGALWFTVGGIGLISIALGTGIVASRRRRATLAPAAA